MDEGWDEDMYQDQEEEGDNRNKKRASRRMMKMTPTGLVGSCGSLKDEDRKKAGSL